jgi:hypothetical protein
MGRRYGFRALDRFPLVPLAKVRIRRPGVLSTLPQAVFVTVKITKAAGRAARSAA